MIIGSASTHFPGNLRSPGPVPSPSISLSVSHPSRSCCLSHLSDLPFSLPLRKIQTLPVGFGRLPQELGQSSRDGGRGNGSSSGDCSQACRRKRAVQDCPQVISPGLASEPERATIGEGEGTLCPTLLWLNLRNNGLLAEV